MFSMCMGKIFLKSNLISDIENLELSVNGIKTNNKIIYKENNVTVTILIYNNKIEMNRVSAEYEINLIFKQNSKTISTYFLFGTSKKFILNTYTKKLDIKDNKLNIDYNLEGNNFSYLLEWRLI